MGDGRRIGAPETRGRGEVVPTPLPVKSVSRVDRPPFRSLLDRQEREVHENVVAVVRKDQSS